MYPLKAPPPPRSQHSPGGQYTVSQIATHTIVFALPHISAVLPAAPLYHLDSTAFCSSTPSRTYQGLLLHSAATIALEDNALFPCIPSLISPPLLERPRDTPCCAYSLLCHAHSNIQGADSLSLPGRTHHCSWQQDVPLCGSPPSLILKVLPYHLLAACSCGAECIALAGHYVSKSLRNKSNMLCTTCYHVHWRV